jgi:hypothetical protein
MISAYGLAANFSVSSQWFYGSVAAVVVALFLACVWHAPLWRVYAATTAASLLVAPHAYGYDAAMLMLGLWLVRRYSGLSIARNLALWLFTPFPFAFTLFGKPWAAVSSLSLLAFLAVLAVDARVARRRSVDSGCPRRILACLFRVSLWPETIWRRL